MRRIADDPTTFFNGSLADDIIADLNDYGLKVLHLNRLITSLQL